MSEPPPSPDPHDQPQRDRQGGAASGLLWAAFAPAVLIPAIKGIIEGSALTDHLCAAFALIWSIVISVPLTRQVSPLSVRVIFYLAVVVGLSGINSSTAFFLGCLTGVERIRF